MNPRTLEAYQLLHDGVLALADMEENGMPIDLDYCKEASRRTLKKISKLEKKILEGDTGKLWKKMYGQKLNFNSPLQMARILFKELKLEPVEYTDTGRPSLNISSLDIMQSRYSLPFIQDFVRMKKLIKAEGTYLRNIEKEAVDGKVHAFYNLHTVQTFRSSSSAPNLQNLPIRDPEIGKLIRKTIKPPKDYHVVEIDFSGIEVSVATCFHKDRNMISYIKDPEKDMHRDCACDAFKLPPEEVSKKIRYVGKNMFVFPQFYGSYYVECARNMWEAVEQLNLVTASGLPLRQHLTQMGITERGECVAGEDPVVGTFEYHIKEVENIFWNERFQQYTAWKRKWREQYEKLGYFDSLTGFRFSGYYRRNEQINYPVQGSAFHCLLYSVINLNKKLKKKKMKSYMFSQIHDSIVSIVHKDELQQYLNMAVQVMTKDIMKEWSWLILPLEVEVEVSPEGDSWNGKEVWIKKDKIWVKE
ncbi:MAG: hypothetical protein DRG27_04895 [Deltaproteobacteria bacterium]|nr:MAG: hypothetical protein DRG27_04895 [Deltaproteobacteria bacterium]